MWTHTKDSQEKISPLMALELLKEGNLRFRNNLNADRNLLKQVNQTSEGQYPFATILSCMDSRTSAELIFDQGLGDIFSIRVAGNVINEDILGSMEYACSIAKSKIIVILGHTQCSAVINACNQLEFGHLTSLLQKLEPAIHAETTTVHNRNGGNLDFVNKVCEHNIHQSIQQIRDQSPILCQLENEGALIVVGGLYQVETGIVRFLD